MFEDEDFGDEAAEDSISLPNPEKIDLVIGGYDAGVVMQQIANLAIRKYADEFRDEIKKAAVQIAQTAIDDSIRAVFATVVDEIISEGWYETDSYGQRNGKKVTVRDRLERALAKDQYGRHSLPAIVDERIKKMFNDELEAGVKRLRGEIDAVIAAKIQGTLAAALGVKTAS